MPKCEICGVLKGNLQQHIKFGHGQSVAGYKAQYPAAEIVDATVRQQRGETYKQTCLARYGTLAASQVPEIRARAAEGLRRANAEKLAGKPVETFMRNGREIRRQLKQRVCEVCGNEFTSTYDQTYCGLACVAEAKRRQRAPVVNEQFFEHITTEQQAYGLGVLAGKGHVADETLGRFLIRLTSTDRAWLEVIGRTMGFTDTVKPVARRGDNRQPEWKLEIYSKPMWEQLHRLGLSGDKRRTAQVPAGIPEELVRHVLRGLYDADGWVTLTENSPGIGYAKSAEALVEYFCAWANRVSGVENHIGFHDNLHTVGYGGKTAVKILDWLYEGATTYREQQYARYVELKAMCESGAQPGGR